MVTAVSRVPDCELTYDSAAKVLLEQPIYFILKRTFSVNLSALDNVASDLSHLYLQFPHSLLQRLESNIPLVSPLENGFSLETRFLGKKLNSINRTPSR